MRARSGFVGIVGADLIGRFDACRSCRMRVGALPQNPTGLPGYTFNWSPETPCPETWMLHHIGRARHDV